MGTFNLFKKFINGHSKKLNVKLIIKGINIPINTFKYGNTTLPNKKGHLIEMSNLSINYGERVVVSNLSFYLENGDRLQIKGKNGSGKSSIIKLILGEDISYTGTFYKQSNLKISYVSQDTLNLSGYLSCYIHDKKLDETLFKTILRKMDFERDQFDKKIEEYNSRCLPIIEIDKACIK